MSNSNSLEAIKIIDKMNKGEANVLINPDQSFFDLLSSAKRIHTSLFHGDHELRYRDPATNKWKTVAKSESLSSYIDQGIYTFYWLKPGFQFFNKRQAKNFKHRNKANYSFGYNHYSPVGKRLMALILDFFIITIISGIAVSFFKLSSAFFGSYMFVGWLYFALFESSKKRATIGKGIMGISVQDTYGRQLTFGAASLRYFLKYISVIPAMIGFMIAWVTPKRQALHDLLAGSVVVDNFAMTLRRQYS